ncbi:MAG TPA: tetratricopeptide repeat protein [Gammaproteobacteria bacterium]
MKAYSTHEVAELLDMRPARIRALARAGFLHPQRTPAGRYLFSFQDLVLLRTAKGLDDAKVAPRRLWSALKAIAEQLPPDRPLSAVRVQIQDDRVLARDESSAWEPESRQRLLDFSLESRSGKVAPLKRRTPEPPTRAMETAEEWFEIALEHENRGASAEAESAYRRALQALPEHVAARINLGRLRHSAGALAEAERLYREALAFDPQHPIARFNLGVVLEDQGRTSAAIETYEEAAKLESHPADVHYNLARLYEQIGDLRSALRHLSRFKALTRHTRR